MSQNSNIETPAAPEWLQKLEDRREKLTRGKLGHELGAGAPCDECGDKCAGLDLHFWRKVCRNCKCRKDQHRCPDDELPGWAQFEILGQIRSKPAFIKIKALASQPVQLEWVPPNVAPDLVSDYMEKLGASQIPISGSDAAQKRKQQLAFQVPPHDLDAALCDSLTESETSQLEQYVKKIRECCVGQGNVVRIGTSKFGSDRNFASEDEINREYAKVMNALNVETVNDPLLEELLSSEKLAKAILEENISVQLKPLIAFSGPLSKTGRLEFENALLLSKSELCDINKEVLCSLVHNGPIYDRILGILKSKNFDISRDSKLARIADFRKEYLANQQFKHNIDRLVLMDNKRVQYTTTTPIKSPKGGFLFHSPLPVTQTASLARSGSQMHQETPIRKLEFGGTSTILYECGLPAGVDYERDPIFSRIINSVPLKNVFENRSSTLQPQALAISVISMVPDFVDDPAIGDLLKQYLPASPVDKQALQSALLNAPFYHRVFETLKKNNIDFNDCKLLLPLQELRCLLNQNQPFAEAVCSYVSKLPNSYAISYGSPKHAIKTALTGSNSSDSGFDSKPTTPNASYRNDLHALNRKFTSIPGIEDMNMYPTFEPTSLAKHMQKLSFSGVQPFQGEFSTGTHEEIKCQDCSLAINFGEVAVKADRAGREIAWHPECFKCHTCRELLADLVYFFHCGQVYCGRDLAIKLKVPRCKACDELIFTKEYTAAEGATFHIKHFCCFQCDTPLAGQQYIPDDKSNMPLCLKCYEEFYAAACNHCKRPIEAAGQGVAWGAIHWHANCFVCSGLNCGKSLIGGRFCVKEDKPFCSPTCVQSINP